MAVVGIAEDALADDYLFDAAALPDDIDAGIQAVDAVGHFYAGEIIYFDGHIGVDIVGRNLADAGYIAVHVIEVFPEVGRLVEE